MDADFLKLIDMIEGQRREKLLAMFTDLWGRFSVAPASVKYHGSFKGGLMLHTVEVVKSSRALWSMYSAQKQLDATMESVTFCALVHDIGKIGDRDQDNYVPEVPGNYDKFTYNKSFNKLDHELLTLFWLNHYGIQVSEGEMAAIYYHAGPYVEAYKRAAETDLLMILNTADNLAAKILKI